MFAWMSPLFMHPYRFCVSGGIADAFMFIMNRCTSAPIGVLASWCGADAVTLAWLMCFTASISWRHVLHACIVFGGRWSTMASDMIGTYHGYTVGILFSTLLRHVNLVLSTRSQTTSTKQQSPYYSLRPTITVQYGYVRFLPR